MHLTLLKDLTDSHVVLVGAACLKLWAQHYQLPDYGLGPTDTFDFFGTTADLDAASNRLAQTPHTTTFSDWDSEAAICGTIHIDMQDEDCCKVHYWCWVAGLTGSEVLEKSLALPLPNTTNTLNALHPVMCLESTLESLLAVNNKHPQAFTLRQAQCATEITQKLIQDLLLQHRTNDAQWAIERVKCIAKLESGRRALNQWGVDVLQAIRH